MTDKVNDLLDQVADLTAKNNALLARVDALAAELAAHQQANTDLRAHCETAETEVESLRREVEERESELARLREAAKAAAEKFLMLRSYLGHEDQDANHAWMADQMREASNALDDALSAALGTGDAGAKDEAEEGCRNPAACRASTNKVTHSYCRPCAARYDRLRKSSLPGTGEPRACGPADAPHAQPCDLCDYLERFCACGRRPGECDGSRKGCSR